MMGEPGVALGSKEAFLGVGEEQQQNKVVQAGGLLREHQLQMFCGGGRGTRMGEEQRRENPVTETQGRRGSM